MSGRDSRGYSQYQGGGGGDGSRPRQRQFRRGRNWTGQQGDQQQQEHQQPQQQQQQQQIQHQQQPAQQEGAGEGWRQRGREQVNTVQSYGSNVIDANDNRRGNAHGGVYTSNGAGVNSGCKGGGGCGVEQHQQQLQHQNQRNELRHVFGNDPKANLTRIRELLDAGDLNMAIRGFVKLAKSGKVDVIRDDPRTWENMSLIHHMLQSQSDNIHLTQIVDLAFALRKFELNAQNVKDLLRTIAGISRYRVETFTPRDMAGLVLSFVSLGVRNQTLMSLIAAEVVKKANEFDQGHLSTTAWGFAKCGLWNMQLVDAIAAAAMLKLHTFTAKSLSNLAWAMSQWGTRKDDLMDAIASQLDGKVRHLFPAALAMIAWSFANLQVYNEQLMAAVSKEAQTIHGFKAQDLAHLAWAFAKLRIEDRALFSHISKTINLKDSEPPELANIAWAFSKINLLNEILQAAIATESIKQLRKFKSGEIAMLTWAFAVAGQQHQQLMTEIGLQVARTISKISGPQLSHIAWAFGALSMRHRPLMDAMSLQVSSNVGNFRTGGLANIAWSCAMVMHRDDNMLRIVAPYISMDVTEMSPLALTRCAWSYRALSVHCPQLMDAIVEEAVAKLHEFPMEELRKLAEHAYSKPSPELEEAILGRTREVAQVLQATWSSRASMAEVDVRAYSRELERFGVSDLGIIGTPQLLDLLNIEAPPRSFMQWCLSQPWMSRALVGRRKVRADRPSDVRSIIAAEYDFSFRGTDVRDRFVRDSQAARCEEVPQATGLLTTVESPQWADQSMYLVLGQLLAEAAALGVDLNSRESCGEVAGSTSLLMTTVPCIGVIGAFMQFRLIFPSVTLTFCDMLVDVPESFVAQ